MAGIVIVYIIKLSSYIWLYGCIYCPELNRYIPKKYFILFFYIVRLTVGLCTNLGIVSEGISASAGIVIIELIIKIYRRFTNGRRKK